MDEDGFYGYCVFFLLRAQFWTSISAVEKRGMGVTMGNLCMGFMGTLSGLFFAFGL
jgi:hypothetical protein